MDLLNILGLLSFILTILALHLLGAPNRWCFPVFIISIVAQVIIFSVTRQWFLLCQMGVLLFYNIRNWISWKKKGI